VATMDKLYQEGYFKQVCRFVSLFEALLISMRRGVCRFPPETLDCGFQIEGNLTNIHRRPVPGDILQYLERVEHREEAGYLIGYIRGKSSV